MNFSTLPLRELEVSHPPGPQKVIDPQWLHLQVIKKIEKEQGEKASLSIINAARRKAEKIVRDSTWAQLKQQKKMEAENAIFRRSLQEELEKEWLAKHVRRLCDEETAHRQAVERATEFILNSLEQVLQTWFDQQPIDSTLCHRLAKQAKALAKEGVLKLRIHPENLALMQENFGDRFTLITDPTLTADSAELSSANYCVEFSLSNHFRQLLAWLRHSDGTEGIHEHQY